MSTKARKSDPKLLLAYDRGMLRSAFVSLFWGIIMERRKRGAFTLIALAKLLGTNKGEVSRWFSGSPNWTLNTIAAVANALNVDLRIEAIDRTTQQVFTPAGLVQNPTTVAQAPVRNTAVPTGSKVGFERPLMFTQVPAGSVTKLAAASLSEAA